MTTTRMLIPSALAALLACGPAAPARAQDLPPDGAAAPANPAADEAIRRALEHLKSTQKADGAWDSGNFGPATSITSLAVMAFLAAGHVPGEPGPYREAIEQRHPLRPASTSTPNGLLVSNTQPRADVLPRDQHADAGRGRRHDPGFRPGRPRPGRGLGRAVELIVKAQDVHKNPDNAGGWRYQPSSRRQRHQRHRLAGHGPPRRQVGRLRRRLRPSIDRAVAYLKRCADKDGGGFAYQPGSGPNNPRTGTGILALEICGDHLTPEAIAGAEYLLKHPPQWASQYFFYEVYYCSQAMFQVGDKYFRGYYPKLVSILLDHQDSRTGAGSPATATTVRRPQLLHLDGASWRLAVEYRYLPIYQR